MSKNPVLTISMLVSNQKKQAMESIMSLNNIRKNISSELVLVYTGHDEQFREQIEAMADKVIDFEWCNDFAKARNAGLDLANGEWFLFLDDDEFFTDDEEIILFFTKEIYKQFGFAAYIVRNYLDEAGNTYSDSWLTRLAKITPELRFEGRVHEALSGKQGEGLRLNSIADHYGYVFGTREAKLAHFERNSSILKKLMEEEPEKIKWGIQMMQEYRSIEDYSNIVECGYLYFNKLKDKDETYNPARGSVAIAIMTGLKGLERYKEANEFAKEVLDENVISMMAQASIKQMQAYCCFELQQYEMAKKLCEDYFESKLYYENNKLLKQADESYLFTAETFDKRKSLEANSIMICAALMLNDCSVLEHNIDQLEWDGEYIYVYEHFREVFFHAIRVMGNKEVFYKLASLIWKKGVLKNYFILELNNLEMTEENNMIIQVFKSVEKADEIKKQIRDLQEKGLQDQVRIVVDKVKEMIPWDEEIKNY